MYDIITFLNEELEEVEFRASFFIRTPGLSDEEYFVLLDTMDNGDKCIVLTFVLLPTSTMVKPHLQLLFSYILTGFNVLFHLFYITNFVDLIIFCNIPRKRTSGIKCQNETKL